MVKNLTKPRNWSFMCSTSSEPPLVIKLCSLSLFCCEFIEYPFSVKSLSSMILHLKIEPNEKAVNRVILFPGVESRIGVELLYISQVESLMESNCRWPNFVFNIWSSEPDK